MLDPLRTPIHQLESVYDHITDGSITVLAELDAYSGGYDWETVQVALNEDGIVMRSGSGCSCNSIHDIDWEPFAMAAFLDYTSSWDPAASAMMRSKVRELLNKLKDLDSSSLRVIHGLMASRPEETLLSILLTEKEIRKPRALSKTPQGGPPTQGLASS